MPPACLAQAGDAPAIVSAASIDMNACQRPVYPKESLDAAEAGTTVLRYVVETDGSLHDVQVERSSGWPRLDQAALEALVKCKGRPALVNGVRMQSFGRFNYNWRPGNAAALQADAAAGCRPSYPVEAVRKELQGKTTLRMSLDDKGTLVKIELVQSSGSGLLDAAAMSGLATCRFSVARDPNGTPIASDFNIEYVWKLE
jgi:TonB family protein